MASWSTKRRWSYISIITIVVIVLIVIPGFFTIYKSPTCFDGIQNQGEQGIDCGGPCQRLCQSAFLPAKIIWADAERIAPGTYNLGAYIENPNNNGAAANVAYTFSVFDSSGLLITEQHGTMDIPANRNTLAFIGMVNTGQRIPAKDGVIFQFDTVPLWRKAYDTLGNLVIGTPQYQEDSSGASLEVSLGNRGLAPYDGVSVFAVLSDKNSNHVGFSRTYLDDIPAGGQQAAPFTWPFSFGGRVVSEEILPVIPPVFSTQ